MDLSFPMRTLGIVGGIAPESTIEYYRLLIASYRERKPDGSAPSIVIDSIDLKKLLDLTAAAAAKSLGLKKLALFGTRFTMQGRFYPEVFSREGIALVLPAEADLAFIHDRYTGELIKGIYRPETREGLLAIVNRLKEGEGIDGVILGGTELPFILTGGTAQGIPLLDTTRIHVEAALDELLGKSA